MKARLKSWDELSKTYKVKTDSDDGREFVTINGVDLFKAFHDMHKDDILRFVVNKDNPAVAQLDGSEDIKVPFYALDIVHEDPQEGTSRTVNTDPPEGITREERSKAARKAYEDLYGASTEPLPKDTREDYIRELIYELRYDLIESKEREDIFLSGPYALLVDGIIARLTEIINEIG